MTVEVLLIILVLCLVACYIVFYYQNAVMDRIFPPAPEPYPVPTDLSEQWVAATQADTLDNIDNWNAKVGDKIWYKPDSGPLTAAQVAQIKDSVEPTVLNPKAAWPFPHSKP